MGLNLKVVKARYVMAPLRWISSLPRKALSLPRKALPFLGRGPSLLGKALSPLRHVLWPFRKIGGFLRRLANPDQAWALFAALLAIALGAFLAIAPVTQLASGRTLGFQWVITLSWLGTGLAAFSGGLALLLRISSFRKFFGVAFFCSLPVAGTFIYKTVQLALEMRSASEAKREELRDWVSGGIQLSAFFVAVSIVLFILLRSKRLKRLNCFGGIMSTWVGPLIGTAIWAAVGSGLGYGTWLLFRWLGFTRGIEFCREAIYAVRVEYFVGGFAALCAAWGAFRALRRRSGLVRPTGVHRPAGRRRRGRSSPPMPSSGSGTGLGARPGTASSTSLGAGPGTASSTSLGAGPGTGSSTSLGGGP